MAGMGMRDIKRKIKSINNTKQITKAMELVSTAKLRKARQRLEATRPYFNTVTNTVRDVMKSANSFENEQEDETKKTLYIVVTGDRGLCGGYNINAIKKALEDIENKENAVFITIGSKARDHYSKRGYEIIESFTDISEQPKYSDAKAIGKIALNMYDEGEVGEVKLIYTRFESTISQVPKRIQLLPVSDEDSQEDENEEVEEEFKYVSYEPSPEAVLSFLIPKYIESTIFGGMVESAASEQAARRVAMESATDNAEEMIDDLTLSFNQARQAAITQEITEIVGGAEALK